MRRRIGQGVMYGSGLLVAVLMCGRSVFASASIQTPEIDSSTISVGLSALAAGVLILRARSRSK
jgi:hypothetical protein